MAAARAAEHPSFPLPAIIAGLRDERHRLDALETGDPASGVRAVLSWSYENLSEPAARLFRLLGVHPGRDLTGPAAASLAGIPLAEASRALGELAVASLLAEHAPGRFGCHDLLRAYAAELARGCDDDADRRAALRRVLDYYLYACAALSRLIDPARVQIGLVPPAPGALVQGFTGPAQALSWLEAERGVLLAAIARAASAGFDAHAWQIPWALEDAFFRRGWWHDIETTQQAALEAAARLGDLAGQAHALCGYGRARAARGLFDEGRADLAQALLLFEKLGDDIARGHTHVRMAFVYARQGRSRDAISHAKEALELFRAAGHQAGQAAALNNIGWYHAQLGDYERALDCSQQAVRAFCGLGDRRGEAIALDSLGRAHQHFGDYARAVALSQRGLAVVRELGDRYSQARILANLGDTHHAAGHYDAARHAWTQALTTLEQRSPAQADQLRARLRSLGC